GALLGVDREALRRSAGRGAQLALSRRGDASARAELPPRSPRPRGGPGPPPRAGLCRPAVLPPRLLRVEARAAVRLVGVQPRRGRASAAMYPLALERRRGRWRERAGAHAAVLLPRPRLAPPTRPRPGARRGRSHRLLSDASRRRDARSWHGVRRPVRAHARPRPSRAADGVLAGPAPRRRRAAGRDRRPQALLA